MIFTEEWRQNCLGQYKTLFSVSCTFSAFVGYVKIAKNSYSYQKLAHKIDFSPFFFFLYLFENRISQLLFVGFIFKIKFWKEYCLQI